jgi:hypothetical protein
MKRRTVALYASVALNVALLVLAGWPRNDANVVLGQTASVVGSYAAISAKGGGNQDALWLANRTTGKMVVFQYQLGSQNDPVQIVGIRNLLADLEERQIGNLMLISTDVSTSNAIAFAIDTDSNKMAVYEYNRPNRTVDGIQKIDLTEAFAGAVTDSSAQPPAALPLTRDDMVVVPR